MRSRCVAGRMDQNDDWAVQRARCMARGTIAPRSDNSLASPPAVATARFNPTAVGGE